MSIENTEVAPLIVDPRLTSANQLDRIEAKQDRIMLWQAGVNEMVVAIQKQAGPMMEKVSALISILPG